MTLAGGLVVAGDVGVEQQQRHAARPRPPHVGQQGAPAGQRHHDLARASRRPRAAASAAARRGRDGVGLRLPAVPGKRLLEVAGSCTAGPTPTIGTPRSEAALRWSPARMPRPPEYCGSTEVMPNSGEKYAMAGGPPAVARLWYQRGLGQVLLAGRPRRRATADEAAVGGELRQVAPATAPRAARRGRGARPPSARGSRLANRSRVGACQDHRRLVASSPRGASGAGRTVRTVNRRMALTGAEPYGRRNAHSWSQDLGPRGVTCVPATRDLARGSHAAAATGQPSTPDAPQRASGRTARPPPVPAGDGHRRDGPAPAAGLGAPDPRRLAHQVGRIPVLDVARGRRRPVARQGRRGRGRPGARDRLPRGPRRRGRHRRAGPPRRRRRASGDDGAARPRHGPVGGAGSCPTRG